MASEAGRVTDSIGQDMKPVEERESVELGGGRWTFERGGHSHGHVEVNVSVEVKRPGPITLGLTSSLSVMEAQKLQAWLAAAIAEMQHSESSRIP